MCPVYRLLGVVLCAVYLCQGCSPPAPGTPPPTTADLVRWADIVAVGKVLQRTDDPAYGNWRTTYGAKVEIQCTYKGGPLPGLISIGNAGFIPGHCDTMDLTVGDKVILLLDRPGTGADYYTQSGAATAYTRPAIAAFLKVCGMDMRYPQEPLPEGGSMVLQRKSCDAVPKQDTCTRPKGYHGEYEETTAAEHEETTSMTTQQTVRVESVRELKSAKTSDADVKDENVAITTSAHIGILLLALVGALVF